MFGCRLFIPPTGHSGSQTSKPRQVEPRAGRGLTGATSSLFASGLGDQPREEVDDEILGSHEDQGARRRRACPRGRASQREMYLGGRAAGLAGYRVGCVLSGPFNHVLFVMWLSGGVSGVGWVMAGGLENERLRETGPLFFCYQGSWGRPNLTSRRTGFNIGSTEVPVRS